MPGRAPAASCGRTLARCGDRWWPRLCRTYLQPPQCGRRPVIRLRLGRMGTVTGISGVPLWSVAQECRPTLHQLHPFVEHTAPPVRGLHLVADCMGERHLDNVVGVTRALRRPVAERRTEAVDRDVLPLHALQ